jgi:hypothetical protein
MNGARPALLLILLCACSRGADHGTADAALSSGGTGSLADNGDTSTRDASLAPSQDASSSSEQDAASSSSDTHDAAVSGEPDAGTDSGIFLTTPFGNLDIHPERLSLYMIPDLAPQYTDWAKVERSLKKLHALVPDAWIRWDNETGHNTDSTANVEGFVTAADHAGVPMIIAASAVDGYDNWWARGNQQPTVSITDIANGPYIAHSAMVMSQHANVRFVETINEPDTMWFVADPDDAGHWDYYMSKLLAAVSDPTRVLGPAVAFKGSKIWNNHAARTALTSFSYHTYGGWQALDEVADKSVYVTEYGFDSVSAEIGDSPGFMLADLWNAEKHGKLSGKIARVFYVNLQKMMRADADEGDHFAFSGQLRVLSLYAALGVLGKHVHSDDAHPDFLASDDRRGSTAVLIWNASSTTAITNETRHIPAISAPVGAPLYVLKIRNVVSNAAECKPLAQQTWLGATLVADSLDVTLQSVEPLSALLLSTKPCDDLAN